MEISNNSKTNSNNNFLNSTSLTPQLNLENNSENYVYKLIDLCFLYFDSNLDKSKYEEQIDEFINNFKEAKSAETKMNVKLMIEFIQKFSNADEVYLRQNLDSISMTILNIC